MKMKVCLVVIYNHNYEKNIETIKRIYAGRFSRAVQIMPFYRGNDRDVIGVYECSYQFQGYITQAAPKFVSDEYSHYVFVADDMCLNPRLTEDNILEFLKLDDRTGFIDYLLPVTRDTVVNWHWGLSSVAAMAGHGNSCEWRNFLPPRDEARRRFQHHGINVDGLFSKQDFRFYECNLKANPEAPWQLSRFDSMGLKIRRIASRFLHRTPSSSPDDFYPFVRSNSDFVVVPQCAMNDFCHYCGVMAAARQFVETAIPTALVLSCDKINTLSTTGLKSNEGWSVGMRKEIDERFGLSYKLLTNEFPEDYIFIHPIKLSKWRDLP